MPTDRPTVRSLLLAVVIVLAAQATPLTAQSGNPTYVDESPLAWELFQRAQAQSMENEGEAVRLYQELLDDFGRKLIPRYDAARAEYLDVRERVLPELRSSETLLERHRLMQTAEAERLLANGDLLRLAQTRPLTEPGLEALLRLAQEALESARFRTAIGWLEPATDHPDLTPDRAAACWFMLGLAAHYLGDAERRHAALEVLHGLDGPGRAVVRELEDLIASGNGPAIHNGVSTLESTETSDLDELVAQTIWSTKLGSSLLNRRFTDPAPDRNLRSAGYERKRRQGDLSTVAATVADSTIFVNEGHSIRALDRFTGRSVWERPFVDRPRLSVVDHESEPVGDLNLIAVEGNSLVSLTGHAYATRRSSEGKVICLDTRTGRLRWSRPLNRLLDDPKYEDLFAHGAPVIAEGRVYVLGRQVTKQNLTGCYVIALDLDSGKPEWIRHVASSGSKARNARPFSTLVHDDNELFVSTAVGAIACLDAIDGTIRWLRSYSVPVNIRGRVRQPWELNAPVVVGSRLFAITPDQRGIVVFDRATGDEIESHSAWSRDRWNSPAYLLANERYVYAVGSEIRAFTTDNLQTPLWRLPAPTQSRMDLDEPEFGELPISPPDSLNLVGRVQAVDATLVVPTLGGILLVDDETGEVTHRLAVTTTGNPMAVGSQLIVAGADALEVYMSFGRAEQMLRDRVAANSGDPEPALSLLQLGVRVRDLSLALEGAELSLQAINSVRDQSLAAGTRRELFEMLLEIHRRDIAASQEEGEALYGMIGAVAATAEQRVEYLLAYGDGLLVHAPEKSVEIFQSILSDPLLAATVRRESGRLRPSAAWSSDRLGRLIRENGPGVYRPQADYARLAFGHLRERSPVDDQAFLELALEFPYADVSVDAAIVAAKIRAGRGAGREALAALSTSYHLAPTAERARPLLGAIVETCVAADRTAQAREILRHLIGAGDLVRLETSDGPRAASEWLAGLAPTGPEPRRARIGRRPAAAEVTPSGRILLPPERGDRFGTLPDRVPILEGTTLRLVTSPDLDPLWTVTLDSPDARLLELGSEQVLMLIGETEDDPHIVAYETATGRRLWSTPRLRDHVNEPIARERGVVSQMPNGQPFDPRGTLACIGHDAVFLIQRTGGVVAFDRAGGGVLWALDVTLDQVHLAVAHDFGLALAGMHATGDGAVRQDDPDPRLLVLDARTGRAVHRLHPQTTSGVIWMDTDALGSLLCANAEGIEVIDLLAGRRRWTNVSYAAMDTRRGWPAGDRIVVESQTSGLFSIDRENGELSESFEAGLRSDWESGSLHRVHVMGKGVFAQYRDRVVRFDLEGNLEGADIVTDTREYRWLLAGEDVLVVISQHDTRQVQLAGETGRRTQRTYRIYIFTDTCKLIGEPIELPPMTKRLRAATLIDGWLLLSTNAETLSLPLE